MSDLLVVRDLHQEFESRGSRRTVLGGLTFTVRRGEVLGVVGESGAGKSTLLRSVACLDPPTQGRVHFDGIEWSKLSKKELRQERRRMQIVFQDAGASFNPRMTLRALLLEPAEVHGLPASEERLSQVLRLTGLELDMLSRRSHQFSGGEKQRIALARALMSRPEMILVDEPISALDSAAGRQILGLLRRLQQEEELTLLLIAHDLETVREVCDRLAVLWKGRLVELGSCREVLETPAHDYTRLLVAAGQAGALEETAPFCDIETGESWERLSKSHWALR